MSNEYVRNNTLTDEGICFLLQARRKCELRIEFLSNFAHCNREALDALVVCKETIKKIDSILT